MSDFPYRIATVLKADARLAVGDVLMPQVTGQVGANGGVDDSRYWTEALRRLGPGGALYAVVDTGGRAADRPMLPGLIRALCPEDTGLGDAPLEPTEEVARVPGTGDLLGAYRVWPLTVAESEVRAWFDGLGITEPAQDDS